MRCSMLGMVVLVLSGSSVRAETISPALVTAEVRAGAGLAVGGGAGQSQWRQSPVTVGALADFAILTEPWTTLYGGAIVEGGDRVTAGITGGVRLWPGHGAGGRLAAGGVAILVPFQLLGGQTALGYCMGGSMRVCGDIEATVFFAGNDLPDDRVAGQLQLVLGVGFSAY